MFTFTLSCTFTFCFIKYKKKMTRDFAYLPGNSFLAPLYFRMADPAHSALARGSLPSVAVAIPWRPVAQIG
jgi:hypothetical protein